MTYEQICQATTAAEQAFHDCPCHHHALALQAAHRAYRTATKALGVSRPIAFPGQTKS